MLAIDSSVSARSGHASRDQATRRLRRPRRPRPGPEPEASAQATPEIVTVFLEPGGAICHSRCQQPLCYQGVRARLEVDFYCLRCIEHVSLPLRVLPDIPIGRRDPISASTLSGWPATPRGGITSAAAGGSHAG